MPEGHSWNLAEWMRALGIRKKEQPSVVHVVQPVSIVGDQSRWAAQLVPPTQIGGGGRLAVVGAYGGFKLTCRAPGGLWITEAVATCGTASNIDWHIVAGTGSVLANVVALDLMQLGDDDTASDVECGTFAAAPGTANQVPRFYSAQQNELRIGGPPPAIRVPNGYTFEMWCAAADRLFQGWVSFWECPAQRGAR